MKVSSRKYECITGRTVTEIFDFKWEREAETIDEFLSFVQLRFPTQEIRLVPGGAEVVITKKVEPKELPKKDDKVKNYKSPGYLQNEPKEETEGTYDKYAGFDEVEEEAYAKKRKKK